MFRKCGGPGVEVAGRWRDGILGAMTTAKVTIGNEGLIRDDG